MMNIKQSSDYRRLGYCPGLLWCLSLFGLLLFIFVIFYTRPADAGELSLLINGKSYHFNPPKGIEYNEENWGGGIQYDYERIKAHWIPFVTATGFIDSFDNASYYVGAGIVRRMKISQGRMRTHLDAGLISFVMTRDDYKKGDPFLGILPAFSFGNNRFAVNATYIPKVDPKMVALWFFQLKIPLRN